MGVSTSMHQEALQEQKRRRRDFQQRIRHAPVHFVRVLRRSGEIVVCAQSRTALGVAYELTPDGPDRWRCCCQGYQWRGWCAHSEAAAAAWHPRTTDKQEMEAAG